MSQLLTQAATFEIDEQPLFAVQAGVPLDTALQMASDFLVCVEALSSEDAESRTPYCSEDRAPHYLAAMAKALVDATRGDVGKCDEGVSGPGLTRAQAFSISGSQLFTVRAGIPVHQAAATASNLLSCASSLAYLIAMGEAIGGEHFAVLYLTEAAKALTDACKEDDGGGQ